MMRAQRRRKKVFAEPRPGAHIKRPQFPVGTASAVHTAIDKLPADVVAWYLNNSEAIPTMVFDNGVHQFQGYQQYQFDPKMKKGTDPIRFYGGRHETTAIGDENLDERIYRGLSAIAQDFGGQRFQTKKIPKKQIATATTRLSTPWWVLDEERFQNFIVRLIDPTLFARLKNQKMTDRDVRHFRKASKCYIALSEFFLDARSDEEILKTNLGVWPSAVALKQYRNRLVKLGYVEYGTRSKPTDFVWNGRHFDLEWAIIRRSV